MAANVGTPIIKDERRAKGFIAKFLRLHLIDFCYDTLAMWKEAHEYIVKKNELYNENPIYKTTEMEGYLITLNHLAAAERTLGNYKNMESTIAYLTN